MNPQEKLAQIRSDLTIEETDPFEDLTGDKYEPIRVIPNKEDVTALAVLEASSELCHLLKKHHQETLQYLQKLAEEPSGHATGTMPPAQRDAAKSHKSSGPHEEGLQRFSYLGKAPRRFSQALSSYWQILWRS